MDKSKQIKMNTRPTVAIFILSGGILLLLILALFGIAVGAANINLSTVWDALFHYNSSDTQHQIIRSLRVPRVIADMAIGAAFAVAGAIMQGITRNPLADSGLLGLNAGSTFMVAVCFAFMPWLSYNSLIIFSFVGAAIGAFLVFGVSSIAGSAMSPTRLVLAGAAVSSLLTALSEGLAIYFQLSQDLAFWYAGGVAGVKWSQLAAIWPWLLGALIAAILLSKSITILSLGDDIAVGLGEKTTFVKIASMVVVLILAGLAVSVVGPVGFIGLIVPHLVRFLVGVDYRFIIPCSAVVGAFLTLAADIVARTINPPYETPISVIFALIGVPFFLYVARKERRNL
ncbi:FecCD family ABC transporter permease [Listeria innocua]|uniref:Iron ABC transporter permease n=4 Tax=Listeria innocua TaxID=1642 RepID=A0AB73HAY7_LISIO|nr:MULTISPECIES: iron ABC transporter permease [Listeria]OEO33754.1 ferrichrome ABC transporter permease [Listeria monocytogenes]EAA0092694.1 iron ABC transporter permease [Listeria innocua]EAC4267429.1 iron ABC transporter permease [Listeria innocua]EAD5686908.1 iron ABC transporter permease [Listeria innocua]EAD5704386.1 iron ABC transporter permease [Listeria innocua]